MIVPFDNAEGFSYPEVQNLIFNEKGRDLVSNMTYEPIKLLIKFFAKNKYIILKNNKYLTKTLFNILKSE